MYVVHPVERRERSLRDVSEGWREEQRTRERGGVCERLCVREKLDVRERGCVRIR